LISARVKREKIKDRESEKRKVPTPREAETKKFERRESEKRKVESTWSFFATCSKA
jgi:hypothetical protein